MSTIELDDSGYDEQLARAVAADEQLAPVDRAIWTEHHIAACEKAHERVERLVRVILLLVLLGIYFGWLA